MPGEKTVTRLRGARPARMKILLAAAALIACWGVTWSVVAANRHQLSHPGRNSSAPGDALACEHGIPPEDLLALVSEGSSEGVAKDGSRITLTLDEELQAAMFALFRRFDPPYGVFAAMEPATGRVVAMVGYRRGGEADPRLALMAVYPAASLIKVVTASAALEKGNISPEEAISYRGGIYGITRKGIHARDGRGTPSMSLEEAIARSANSVFGKVTVNYVGSEGLAQYMADFGFGQSIPFDLPVEPSQGYVPKDEFNLARTGAGFGEVYVSPLHMAMIMSAIGNSGQMPRPFLVERVEDKDGKERFEAEACKWRDTVKPETADALLQMMVKTIEMGTSRRTFGSPDVTPLLQDMEVAGKTGSLSGWSPRMHFEWFAGTAPVGDPKLAVTALVVNDNRGKIKGSYVGKEAFNTYFGYPNSSPPAYSRKAHSKKARVRLKQAGKKSRKGKAHAGKSRGKKAAPPSGGVHAPKRNAPLG